MSEVSTLGRVLELPISLTFKRELRNSLHRAKMKMDTLKKEKEIIHAFGKD